MWNSTLRLRRPKTAERMSPKGCSYYRSWRRKYRPHIVHLLLRGMTKSNCCRAPRCWARTIARTIAALEVQHLGQLHGSIPLHTAPLPPRLPYCLRGRSLGSRIPPFDSRIGSQLMLIGLDVTHCRSDCTKRSRDDNSRDLESCTTPLTLSPPRPPPLSPEHVVRAL